jgi:ubiquinone/menaquinone biosynthesis C-methylase UbiE
MNEAHLRILSSDEWVQTLKEEFLPWLARAGDLGDNVLELGPGPGLTTNLLMQQVGHLTVVELDPGLATALADRLGGTNVTVVHGDATSTGLDSDLFTAVVCFSMLHHVPSPPLQNFVFQEASRVLTPGGRFTGVDTLDTEAARELHVDDVYVPVPPTTLRSRLAATGFGEIAVETTDRRLRFMAQKA